MTKNIPIYNCSHLSLISNTWWKKNVIGCVMQMIKHVFYILGHAIDPIFNK
jgi:hypothetical protein